MAYLYSILFSAFFFSSAGLAAIESEIPEFHPVANGIYRGGRPSAMGLRELAKLGIKTIVNLENVPEVVGAESRLAESLGMRMVSRPMSGFFRPENENVDAILALLADANNYPLFLHCQHGQDRTGLIIGLFRVLQQGWDPERAYQEMWDYNFHAYTLFPLYDYFRYRTSSAEELSVSAFP